MASSGAFLVTSEMALFQLCVDAKVRPRRLRLLAQLTFKRACEDLQQSCTSNRLLAKGCGVHQELLPMDTS